MTIWRLSGLIWMAVVALGLVLVAVRVTCRRGTRWLVNANLAVCLAVLLSCGLADLKWIVAEWNATIAMQRPRQWLDTAYMMDLGPSAIPALLRLQSSGYAVSGLLCGPDGPDRLVFTTLLPAIAGPLRWQQRNWQTYTLRDSLYLAGLDRFAANCGATGNR